MADAGRAKRAGKVRAKGRGALSARGGTPERLDPDRLTIGALQGLIRERYYTTDASRGTPATFMWFIEEVGELSTALANNAPGKRPTRAQRANLDEEFADVLAWLCTLANINGVDLQVALKKYTVKGVAGVKS